MNPDCPLCHQAFVAGEFVVEAREVHAPGPDFWAVPPKVLVHVSCPTTQEKR